MILVNIKINLDIKYIIINLAEDINFESLPTP